MPKVNWFKMAFNVCKVGHNANQTVPGDGTPTKLNFNQVLIDRGGMSTGDTDEPIEIQEQGEYDVFAQIGSDALAADGQVGLLVTRKRGVTETIIAGAAVSMKLGDGAQLVAFQQNVACEPGDIIFASVSQWSGENLLIGNAAQLAPMLTVRRVF